jgi:hypothetical protein
MLTTNCYVNVTPENPQRARAKPYGQDPSVEVLAQVPLDEAPNGIPVPFCLPHSREPCPPNASEPVGRRPSSPAVWAGLTAVREIPGKTAPEPEHSGCYLLPTGETVDNTAEMCVEATPLGGARNAFKDAKGI